MSLIEELVSKITLEDKMAHRIKTISIVSAATLMILAMIGTAGAQLDNRPFSFKNSPTGSPGMSTGGKQAIINEKLFDSTPENLQRGSNGVLVDVVEGPGHTAIVFKHGTNSSLPGFRGSSFRGDNTLMQVGIFNPYFGQLHDNSSYGTYSYSQFQTSALINSWTASVMSGNTAPPYYGNNPVDSWTGYVQNLNKE